METKVGLFLSATGSWARAAVGHSPCGKAGQEETGSPRPPRLLSSQAPGPLLHFYTRRAGTTARQRDQNSSLAFFTHKTSFLENNSRCLLLHTRCLSFGHH